MEDDPITPSAIRHEIDGLRRGRSRTDRGNFLVYEFEFDGYHAKARVYLDEIDTVSVYGPYKSRDGGEQIDAPKFASAVISYLKRRFMRIQVPSSDLKQPYKVIWQRPEG